MYDFSKEARPVFEEYLRGRMARPQFANGRSVRNALDRIRLRHASRIMASGRTPTRQELMTFEPEDIQRSRVFNGPVAAS